MDQPSPSPAGLSVRVAQLLLLVAVCAFTTSVLPGVRGHAGFDDVLDGWLQGAAYLLTAVVAALRPVTSALERTLWTLVAAALVLRAFGFVVFLGWVRRLDPVPYPSLADAGWLAMSAVLFAALVHLARRAAGRPSPTLVLDSITGGLTVAAVTLTFLYGTLERLTGPGTPSDVLVVNLLYPLADVALLVLVAGVLATTGWRPAASTAALAVGVVGFAVVDCVFLYQVSAGTYRPGTYLAALSLLATAGIAMSGWLPQSPPASARPTERAERAPGLVVPALLAMACVVLVSLDAVRPVPAIGIVLASAGLLAAMARVLVTVLQDRSAASRTLRAANDELLKFQALVETSGDFIAIALLDGSVAYVNPAGRRLVGLPDDADVTTTTIVDYLTEEGQRASLEVEQPVVVADGRWEGESTLRDLRGGPPIPVAISSFLMFHPETGEPLALATVQRDITERILAESALRQLAEQRQTLLARLVQAQEDERARIAEDVHDDSVQALAAVELRLGLLRREVDQAAPALVPGVDVLADTVTSAAGRLRNLLFDLESPALETDLRTALREAAGYLFDGSGVSWSMTGVDPLDLPAATRVTAYRIAKEALVNARKHAGARQVTVDLGEDDDGVVVTVSDDGVGFDPELERGRARPGHHGLTNMSDRAEVAGGRLQVRRPPTGGTEVRVWLPRP